VLFSIAGLATQIFISDNKKKKYFLLDAGDGTTRDIVTEKISYSDIIGIALSHGHYDHCSGLFSLLGFFRMLGREKAFHIIYPENSIEIKEIINLFTRCYPETIPFPIERHPIPSENSSRIKIDSFTIIPVNVLHYGSTMKYGTGSRIPALGYKITLDNVIISYSGDTGPTNSLEELFDKNVDLALIEGTHPDSNWIKDKEKRYHLTHQEAISFTSECKEKKIIHTLHESVVKHNSTNN
ncbi:MAG: MBL fold metallo-hydrolase, partial [Candidatus Thorarchaeota archaeon]